MCLDYLNAWPQHQVKGIAKEDFCPCGANLICAKAFDRPAGANGHKAGCFERPALGEMNGAAASMVILAMRLIMNASGHNRLAYGLHRESQQ